MFGELFGVQESRKPVAFDVAVALGQELPEDLGFERLKRRCTFGDLFEGIAHLRVFEAVGAVWMRNQVVERDFRWCGHGGQLSIDVHKSYPILFVLRTVRSQLAPFSAHRARRSLKFQQIP